MKPTEVHNTIGKYMIPDADRIVPVIQNLWDTMDSLDVAPRSIGVAGLNPHAGEDGAFGDEEIEVITPAVVVCLLKTAIPMLMGA